jgi:hypothetical protein
VVNDAAGGARADGGAATNQAFDYDNAAVPSEGVWVNGTGVNSPSWTLDLGGLYADGELAAILVFANRYRALTAANRVELLNWLGEPVFSAPLSGAGAITVRLPLGSLYAPSQTATATASPTASVTPVETTTPSVTATLSTGASPSATATPMSVHPVTVRVAATGQCFHFVEVLVFSAQGRLISHAPGAVAASLTAYDASPANAARNAIDGCIEIAESTGGVTGGCGFYHSVCGGSQWWNVTFAPGAGFPSGLPQPVGAIYFVNRVEGNLGPRLTAGGGALTTHRVDGSVISSYPLLASMVTHIPVNPIVLPGPHVGLEDATEEQKQTLVRSVRLQGPANTFMNFKEFMLLDADGVNVVLGKPTSAAMSYIGDASSYPSSEGNNGIVDAEQGDIDLCVSGASSRTACPA